VTICDSLGRCQKKPHSNQSSSIEDSTGFSGPEEFFDTMQEGYTRNHWLDQPIYAMVATGKDAMVNLLAPVIEKWNVPFGVFRGNPSNTMCYEIGTLFSKIHEPIVVLYLGDHDPSGMNISL
jgi:hypothetical protein